ncbi:MAG: hypothetical protein WBV80_05095 [Mycobacterium sp.]
MMHLQVGDLPDEATVTLLGVYSELSQSPGSVSGAPLARLSAVEIAELRQALADGERAGGDDDLVDWCTKMGRLVTAELYLRAYTQAAIDAKAAVIVDEERRIARMAGSVPGPSPAA